jgi:hypothetical protein
VSVQYGSLSGSISSKPESAAGIKSGPNQVVNRTTSISRGSVTLCSGLYLFMGIPAFLWREFSLTPAGKNRSGQFELEDPQIGPVSTTSSRWNKTSLPCIAEGEDETIQFDSFQIDLRARHYDGTRCDL